MKKSSFVLSLLLLLGACSGNSGSTQQVTTTVAAPTTTTEPEKVTIPDVGGLDKSEGRRILEELGLVVTLKEVKSDVPLGEIVSQSPSAGKLVAPGWPVTLNYAILPIYDLQVKYEVRDGFARDLGDGFCDFPKQNVVKGQAFVLIGPFSEQLSSFPVPEKGKWSTVDSKICYYILQFTKLPKVATYRLQDPKGDIYPPQSFEELEQRGWNTGWYWGNI